MQIDQTKSMNRTTRDGGFKKMTYAQKLDQFMETNKLKYINEKPPQPKIINPIPMDIFGIYHVYNILYYAFLIFL